MDEPAADGRHVDGGEDSGAGRGSGGKIANGTGAEREQGRAQAMQTPSPRSGPEQSKHEKRKALFDLAATLSLLVFFSLWGLLTREGLVALNTYAGQSIQPVIWAQAIGCLVMGWASANKRQIDALYPPLYTGITTGYCGSVTTFSSWVLQVFLAFSNHARYNRSGIYSVSGQRTERSRCDRFRFCG